MAARIMVETTSLRPVINGRWHHAQLRHIPADGETIHTLCGLHEPAKYEGNEQIVVQTCWDCDLAYRRQHDIPWLGADTHPALRR